MSNPDDFFMRTDEWEMMDDYDSPKEPNEPISFSEGQFQFCFCGQFDRF